MGARGRWPPVLPTCRNQEIKSRGSCGGVCAQAEATANSRKHGENVAAFNGLACPIVMSADLRSQSRALT
jgi:hypothetical protein